MKKGQQKQNKKFFFHDNDNYKFSKQQKSMKAKGKKENIKIDFRNV